MNDFDKQPTLFYDPELESVAQANRDALVKVMLETGMPIAASEWGKWRPTKRTLGTITGMPVNSICLATDGNLAIFQNTRDDGHNMGRYFIGHCHRFEWTDGGQGVPEMLFGRAKKDTEGKEKAPRKDKATKAKEFAESV